MPSPLLAEIRALTRDRDRLLETQQAVESPAADDPRGLPPGAGAAVLLGRPADHAVLRAGLPDPATAVADQDHPHGRVPAPAPLHRPGPGTGPGRADAGQPARRLAGHGGRQVVLRPVASPGCCSCSTPSSPSSTTPSPPPSPSTPTRTIFASFPGVGPVLTAVLLAEIGEDRARFPRPRCCSPRPGWPRSPAPRAAPAASGSAMRPTPASARAAHVVGLQLDEDARLGRAAFRDARDHRGSATTAPCAASAPAGCASCGAAGPTNIPYDPATAHRRRHTEPHRQPTRRHSRRHHAAAARLPSTRGHRHAHHYDRK